jgi:NAD(P)-dependent dehydrogenase (short-subunit alcohol dehydrogenase family)
MTMAGCVEGKVALVTGGASGIGRATALTFAREGAKLIVADMHEDAGQQTVHMLTEQGGEAIFVRTDVSKAVEVQALISKAVETYGRLDCAHNNAGIASGVRSRTADYPEERWHRVIAVNLTGVWLCMKYEIVQMLHQGGGAIVNTASIAGLVGGAGGAAYAQFIGLCSSLKWSGPRTTSPCLALPATAGSNAAYKIISACSNAVW